MNERDIITLLSLIEGRRVHTRTSGSGWVQAPCPFARWNHSGGTDRNASFGIKINNNGPSGYHCMSCAAGGKALYRMTWYLGMLRGERLDEANLFLAQCEQKDFDPSRLLERSERKLERHRDPIAFMMGLDPHNKPWINLVQQDLLHAVDIDIGSIEDPQRPRIAEDRLRGYRREYHPYMEKRGISRETADRWGLMVEPHRIGDRIVFPIRDSEGHLLAYSKRVTWDRPVCQSCGYKDPEGTSKDDATIRFGTRYNANTGEGGCPSCRKWVWPKYQHSKGFRRNFYLYGEHLVDQSHKTGVLTEGNLNPIRLDQLGVRNAVATFGAKAGNSLPDVASGTPGEQLYQAAKLFDTIVMFADGDEAGEEWVERNSQFFRMYFANTHTLHVVRSPAGMDPADQSLSDRDVIDLLGDYDVFRT